MICGRSTDHSRPLCTHELGTAIYFLDEEDLGLIHLLALNIKQKEDLNCAADEPSVFLLLSTEKNFLNEYLGDGSESV